MSRLILSSKAPIFPRCTLQVSAGARRLPALRMYETEAKPPAMPYGPGIAPPLKGIRILDLTRVLAGPTATMLLADLGADVIKVEEVSRGDDTRSWNPPSAPLSKDAPSASSHLPPESVYFLSINRNKRSMTVNFKSKEGLEIMRKLVASSDILVENFVSGKLASMGLGYEDCKTINPRLIYASITGYGQTGPYRTAAGYDVIIEAEAGLMHITGEADRPPSKVGVAATDIATGLYAHGAIMAALLSRQQTGKGVWIDCNLFESQIAGLANIASNYLIAGKEAGRHGTAHPSVVPYQVFPCRNGYLMIGAGNDKQFKILAEKVLGDVSLASNPKFRTNDARVENRAELVGIITDVLMKHDREHWLECFTGLGVPFGPINNIEQTFKHPQAVARQVTIEVDHARAGKIKLVAPAVSYNGQKMAVRLPPPWLSEHTQEVMEELGYSAEEIAGFRERGIWTINLSVPAISLFPATSIFIVLPQDMPVIQQHAPVPQSHIIPSKDAPASPKPRAQDAPRRPSPPPAVPVKDIVEANVLPKPETKSQKDDLKASPSSSRRSPTPTPSSALAAAPVPSRPGAESAPQPSPKAVVDDDASLPDTSHLSLINMETFEQILELDEDEVERDFSRPMVQDYFDQAVKTFQEMDDAIADKDLERLSDLGHFLKGSSAALGLSRVQDSCEKIQHYGHRRDEETTKNLTSAEAIDLIVKTVKRVKIDYKEAKAWLNQYFGDDD